MESPHWLLRVCVIHPPAEPCVAIEGSGPPCPLKKMRMYAVGWDQSMDKPLKVVRRRILISID
jgi:hypothetical protein